MLAIRLKTMQFVSGAMTLNWSQLRSSPLVDLPSPSSTNATSYGFALIDYAKVCLGRRPIRLCFTFPICNILV